MKPVKIYDGTDPGATPGRVFTASIGQETIVPEGKFLDHLCLGLKGAVSTAAVVIETFAGVLSEYSLRVGAETRILANMRQLCALMKAYYDDLPFIWENTDNTGNDFIGGVRVPIQAPVDAAKPITHASTYATQTNIGTETLAISGYFDEDAKGKKPIHAVSIGMTTAGAAGYDVLGFRLAPVGKLRYLIIQQLAKFADGNVDNSVQRVRILVNGQIYGQFNALADSVKNSGKTVGVIDPMDDLMTGMDIFDLGESGLDCKGQEVVLALDVQDVSDAITILPVIEME